MMSNKCADLCKMLSTHYSMMDLTKEEKISLGCCLLTEQEVGAANGCFRTSA